MVSDQIDEKQLVREVGLFDLGRADVAVDGNGGLVPQEAAEDLVSAVLEQTGQAGSGCNWTSRHSIRAASSRSRRPNKGVPRPSEDLDHLGRLEAADDPDQWAPARHWRHSWYRAYLHPGRDTDSRDRRAGR
jgi:hypothetical protein